MPIKIEKPRDREAEGNMKDLNNTLIKLAEEIIDYVEKDMKENNIKDINYFIQNVQATTLQTIENLSSNIRHLVSDYVDEANRFIKKLMDTERNKKSYGG